MLTPTAAPREMKMSDAQHTPGPWTIRESDQEGEGDWLIDWDGHGKAESPCGYSSWRGLAEVHGSEDGLPKVHAEGRANARLIAAAPELLAALLVAVDYSEHTDECAWNKHLDNRFCDCWKRQARAAIAKATGVQP